MSRTVTKALIGLCIISAVMGGYLVAIGHSSGGAVIMAGVCLGVISYRQLRSSAVPRSDDTDRG